MSRIWVAVSIAIGCVTCEVLSASQADVKKPELSERQWFAIYEDTALNGFAPRNWMPAEAKDMIAEVDEDCHDQPRSGKNCVRVLASGWQKPYWFGVGWALADPQGPDAPYWGEAPTVAWDLRGAREIRFAARAPRPCVVRLKACAVNGKPYGDSATEPIESGPLALTSEWKDYVIPVDNADLSRVVNGFTFVASRDDQPDPNAPLEFYIDDIGWSFAPATKSSEERFYIYADQNLNGWAPAGWMPEEAAKLVDVFKPDCTDDPQEGQNCLQVKISKWDAPYWCGVTWTTSNPARPGESYWGEKPGPGWDLSGSKRVVFWARAPKPCRVQFKACIARNKPYGDSAESEVDSGFITLTPEWKEYSLSLGKRNLSRVVTGFVWVTNRDEQPDPNQPMEFYLDSIYWECTNPTQNASP